jgi:hypothetical protein
MSEIKKDISPLAKEIGDYVYDRIADEFTSFMKNMEKGQAGFQKKVGSEIKTIKDDIEYLKKKSSKAIVRKRIALAVFIAVIVAVIFALLLHHFDYL